MKKDSLLPQLRGTGIDRSLWKEQKEKKVMGVFYVPTERKEKEKGCTLLSRGPKSARFKKGREISEDRRVCSARETEKRAYA